MFLENLRANMSSLLTNKKFLMIIVLVSLFLGIAIYVYTTYISPKLDPSFVPNKEFVKDEGPEIKKATMFFFYADWCPHSKKSKPIFEKVKEQYNGKPINGIVMNFKMVNGEQSEEEVNSFEKQHKIQVDGYPSIYLVKGDQIIEYDAKPTVESLTEFLNTAL